MDNQAQFFGRTVTVNTEDGLPIKNHLPHDLGAEFRTKNQWLTIGYTPAVDAPHYEMHPSMMSRRTYTYFHKGNVYDAEGLRPDESEAYSHQEATIREALKKSTGHGGLSNHGNKRIFG